VEEGGSPPRGRGGRPAPPSRRRLTAEHSRVGEDRCGPPPRPRPTGTPPRRRGGP
jgi:hypothetical protein